MKLNIKGGRGMKLFKNFKRKSRAEIALHIFVSAIFMIVALSYLYILVWALIAGLRTNSEIVMNPFGLLKKGWKPIHLIFLTMVVGVVGALIHIF